MSQNEKEYREIMVQMKRKKFMERITRGMGKWLTKKLRRMRGEPDISSSDEKDAKVKIVETQNYTTDFRGKPIKQSPPVLAKPK